MSGEKTLYELLINEESFAKTTDEYSTSEPCSSIQIGLDFLQNGGVAPTLAQILALIDEIHISYSGYKYIEAKLVDLIALQYLSLGKSVEVIIPGGDNEIGGLYGIKIPVGSKDKAKVKVLYTGHATVDEMYLTVSAKLGSMPVGSAISYKTHTSTTALSSVNFDSAGLLLDSLLMFATTIPTTANNNRTIKEVKVKAGGKEYAHDNWFTLSKGKLQGNALDDTNLGAVLDNYRILELPTTVRADDLDIITKSDTATDTARFIGLFQKT